MGFKTAGFPKFGFNPMGFKQSIGGFASLVKAAGGVLYLDARKADGSGPLTGNDSPWFNKLGETNLYNPYDVDIGKLLDPTTGELSNNASAATSNFISIKPSTQHVKTSSGFTNRYAFYDENFVYISGQSSGSSFTSPFNSVYVKVCMGLVDVGYYQLNEGTILLDNTNGTLTNFAGTGTSGWQATPNLLRFDPVDDYLLNADTASLDVTVAPLALGNTFYISTGTSSGWLRARDNVNIQYGAFFNSVTTEIEFWLEDVKRASVAITLDAWQDVLFFWDGTDITPVLNNVDQATVGFVGTLTSQPNNYSGRRTSGGYLGHDRAIETIYTGSDLAKIKKAQSKISAEYLALNP